MAYTFFNIIFPSDTFTQALGIAGNDEIVGFHGQTTNLGYSLILPSTFLPIKPTGAAQTQVVGINAGASEIVGFFVDTSGVTHGFLDKAGTISKQDETGTAFNQLLGVNDKNAVAGYSSLDPAGQINQLAYVFNATGNGTFKLLDNAAHTLILPANVNSQATGIDNAGDVVGFYLPTAMTSNGYLLLAGSSTPITLQFPGSTFTQALGINNQGQVTGFYNDSANKTHGFIWSNDNWTSIDVPGASATTINSINDSGHIVGFDTVGTETDGFRSNAPFAQATDNTTNKNWQQALSPYTGPVTGIDNEFVDITPDKLNLTSQSPNVFLHTGSGDDALLALSGTNVLDGGTGSNFLTNGSSGKDTDFVDARGATSDIWSTMNKFISGDSVTVFGVTADDFKSWIDGQGAVNFSGLTTHIPIGLTGITASLTLVGYTMADLASGKLSVSFGDDAASGSPFMFIHGT